jgi:16S rRNA (cytosine967-C5)-methyltransferase
MASGAFAGLNPLDRSFARALVMATLRRLGSIDRVLQARVKKAPPDVVVHILRLGAAELLHLDTPDHAAVDSAVRLTEKRAPPFKGLVNAVLRGLARERPIEPPPDADVPAWLVSRWRSAYGEGASAIAAAVRIEPPTDLTPRDPADAEALAAELEGELLPTGSIRVRRGGRLEDWPASPTAAGGCRTRRPPCRRACCA